MMYYNIKGIKRLFYNYINGGVSMKMTEKIILCDKNGCDFIVNLPCDRKGTKIKLLQITDMQMIDSNQMRTPDRLRIDEINAWAPQNLDAVCGNHIRALVAQTEPDLIFITGDIVFGSFDDNGTTLEWFCDLMDSFEIPWAPVFGNHENESKKGVKWQCEQFENSKWCVFKRGNVSGNSNYTVGIAVGDDLVRVLHMLDSNGCYCEDPEVLYTPGIFPDQIELIKKNTKAITEVYNKNIPAFCAFHIPTWEFFDAEVKNGYAKTLEDMYTIGVDVPKKNGDFGFKMERYAPIQPENEVGFLDTMKECNVQAVFAGHCHGINTCIYYEGIKWVFGLKTGGYDYHVPGQLGGTLITIDGSDFDVVHTPALVPHAPFPGGAAIFKNFFAEDKFIIGSEK